MGDRFSALSEIAAPSSLLFLYLFFALFETLHEILDVTDNYYSREDKDERNRNSQPM